MSLAKKRALIFENLKESLSVLAARHPVAEIGDVYEDIEESFQALACCHLLGDAERNKFQKNLYWAALARRKFQQRCASEGNQSDFRTARSRSEGMFCALAAGDIDLAREIGRASPSTFLRDGEYEEDFAYHAFVHLLIEDVDDKVLASALSAFQSAAAGESGERLAVCEALCVRDGASFEEAFPFLVSRQVALMGEEREGSEDRPSFEPCSRLFIEGLALLKLAERRGIRPQHTDYAPLCPSVARMGDLAVRPDDIFSEL